jgi:hypothetical protein
MAGVVLESGEALLLRHIERQKSISRRPASAR